MSSILTERKLIEIIDKRTAASTPKSSIGSTKRKDSSEDRESEEIEPGRKDIKDNG